MEKSLKSKSITDSGDHFGAGKSQETKWSSEGTKATFKHTYKQLFLNQSSGKNQILAVPY
jgi:hypothetical protein